MTRLLIHAGIHRTGTTALQGVLAESRSALRNKGILYPFEGKNHQDIAWSIFLGEMTGADLRGCLEEELREGISQIILSGEDFCIHEDLSWVSELQLTFDVEVAFYLRRQDLWLASWYNQHVKWPFNREKSQASPREFLETVWEYHWLDFARLLARWESAVGLERVHVALVDSAERLDVVSDFAGLLGVDPPELQRSDRRENDSLPAASLEIARHLDLIDRDDWQRNLITEALRQAFCGRSETSETIFSPAERRRILEQFADSNAAVARTRFARDELFRAALPADEDSYFEFPDVDRGELLREWVAPFINELLRYARNGSFKE